MPQGLGVLQCVTKAAGTHIEMRMPRVHHGSSHGQASTCLLEEHVMREGLDVQQVEPGPMLHQGQPLIRHAYPGGALKYLSQACRKGTLQQDYVAA